MENYQAMKDQAEKDIDDVVSETKEYYKQDLYDNFDLRNMADDTTKNKK